MPVLNLPSSAKLHDFALALHFDAWESVLSLIADFEIDEKGDFKARPAEWAEFISTANRELEMTTNFIAQASELGMKAQLCDVSPYLLLLGQADALRHKKSHLDFSNMRTIDAVDLPNAIGVFCDHPLPNSYIDSFHEMRTLRNKSIHMGESFKEADPFLLIGALVLQFRSLWPDRKFLREWLRYSGRGTNTYWHKDGSWTRETHLFRYIPFLHKALSKGQFKRLFKRDKSTRRYICMSCLSEAETDSELWEPFEIQTCYLSEQGDAVECEVCQNSYPVKREDCLSNVCPGNVISSDHPDVDAGVCHTCREYQGEVTAKAETARKPASTQAESHGRRRPSRA